MKHLLFLSLMLMSMASPCFSQEQKDPLTNENVISLFKAGLSKSLIVTTIQNSPTKFDVSADAIITLKNGGLPDDVITAMVSKQNAIPVAATPPPVVQPNPVANDVKPKRDAGIYYEDPASGTQTQLESSIFSQAKSGSFLLTSVTYGIAKTKAKAVLSGAQANFQIPSENPVFYFVFPTATNGNGIGNESTGGLFSNATNPNEFILIKFKVAKKGREVVTGSFGTYSGFSSGIDDDNKVAYRFTKVSSGLYKVYFETPLPQGEYAFIFAGTTTGSAYAMGGATTAQKAFDFSITK